MTDDQLGPHGRALLDAARPALGPDPETARRMRARIAATVGGGAAAGVAAKSTFAAKLGLVGVVAALAIGAVVYGQRTPPSAPTRAPFVAQTAAVAPVPPVIEPTAPEIEQEMPAIDLARPKANPPIEITLAREVELVDHAMAALKAHDPRAALASLHTYGVEARGHGQLAEDAAAIEVEARCALADPEAPSRLAAFERRYPRSAQRARLAELCK